MERRIIVDDELKNREFSVNAKPIFIVGMNGSGTTMVQDCLDRHPYLYGFPRETRLIPYYIQNLASYGDLNNDENFYRLWNDFRNISLFKSVNNGKLPEIPDNWSSWPRNIASIFDGVYSQFSKKKGKNTRWVEKTPMNVLHMIEIAEVFPNARFIHMVRDGRDCAASFHRRWKYNAQWTVFRWKNVVSTAREQGQSLGKSYLEVRYEDLTNDPEKWMKIVCAFVDVEFNSAVLESKQRHYEGKNTENASTSQIVPNSQKWRKYFSSSQLKKLELIGGVTLQDFGYETIYEAKNLHPSKWKLKYWVYSNYLRRGAAEFIIQIRKNKGRSWRYLFSHIINAIRQRKTTKF